MALFDRGRGLDSITNVSGLATTAVGGSLGTANRLAGALRNLSNPAALISSLRSLNLPKGGEAGLGLLNASAQFGGQDASNDWRVRLSVPASFSSSPLLRPLVEAGGLVFPYTPTIQISSSASYEDQPLTHQNYQFSYYQNSRIDQIQIIAPFNVEDAVQGLYWLAAIHLLRSATKMFTGDGALSGNPPPLLKLNGYGDYVFKNVPVVVKSFTVDLPQEANYINTAIMATGITTSGPLSTVAGLAGAASQYAGLAGAIGANVARNALGTIGALGNSFAGMGGLGSAAASLVGGGPFSVSGNSWVPTKSTINITVQPVYSRESARQFSLQRFANGEYVNGGYI